MAIVILQCLSAGQSKVITKRKKNMKNLIAFFEIPVTDFYQSVNFYQAIFGVKLMVAEYSNEKMACFVQDGQTVGAISYAPDFKPSEHGVLIHFNCEDIDWSIQQVLKQGGSIAIPKTKIQAEGKEYFAVFTDPAGNRIGLYAD